MCTNFVHNFEELQFLPYDQLLMFHVNNPIYLIFLLQIDNRIHLFLLQIENPIKHGHPRGIERLQVVMETICLRRTKLDEVRLWGQPVCVQPFGVTSLVRPVWVSNFGPIAKSIIMSICKTCFVIQNNPLPAAKVFYLMKKQSRHLLLVE
jgi:hypothetical protein